MTTNEEASAPRQEKYAHFREAAAAAQWLADYLTKNSSPDTDIILTQAGLLIRRLAPGFNAPQVSGDLDDLGQAVALLRHRVNALQSQPPEVEATL